MTLLSEHNFKVKFLSQQIKDYSKFKSDKKLRFYHGDSHSTREENKKNYYWVNISDLDNVIEINKEEKYVLVEPNVPMDKLVTETLKQNLIPKIVMEFPGITVGGGINGAALESSSFKYGQFNDNCAEYEVILGNGEIVKASGSKNPDLFYGISGSYGTLSLVTLIKVNLIPSKKYVKAIFYPTKNYEKTLNLIDGKVKNSNLNFVEGLIFDKNRSVVITGELTDQKSEKVQTYLKASDPWFGNQAENMASGNNIHEESIPILDYLFRYNRGCFWIGEYAFPMFHMPKNRVTKFLFNPLFNTRKLHDGMVALNLGQKFFVQDFYLPFNKSLKLLKFSEENIGIYPIWLCPIKSTDKNQKLSPHYLEDKMLMDVGIWGKNEKYKADKVGLNRRFEEFVKSQNGRKMLYAHAYYSEEEFWKIYNRKWYENLRKKYYSKNIFPDVWKKTHTSLEYQLNMKGGLKIISETLRGKHLKTLEFSS